MKLDNGDLYDYRKQMRYAWVVQKDKSLAISKYEKMMAENESLNSFSGGSAGNCVERPKSLQRLDQQHLQKHHQSHISHIRQFIDYIRHG